MYRVLPLLIAVLIWTNCGSSGSEAEDPAEEVDDATVANTAGDALSDSLGGSLGGGGGPSNLTKNQMSEEGEDSSSMASYSCTISEDHTSQTCDCPGGGSVTYSYGDEFVVLETGGSFEQTTTVTFDACVVPSCGGDQTMNGEVSGHISGTVSETGFMATASMATAGECSGLTVGDTELGFSFTMTLDGTSETVSGEIAVAPACEVITFDSWDDLMTEIDPDGTCEE